MEGEGQVAVGQNSRSRPAEAAKPLRSYGPSSGVRARREKLHLSQILTLANGSNPLALT